MFFFLFEFSFSCQCVVPVAVSKAQAALIKGCIGRLIRSGKMKCSLLVVHVSL